MLHLQPHLMLKCTTGFYKSEQFDVEFCYFIHFQCSWYAIGCHHSKKGFHSKDLFLRGLNYTNQFLFQFCLGIQLISLTETAGLSSPGSWLTFYDLWIWLCGLCLYWTGWYATGFESEADCISSTCNWIVLEWI